MGWSRVSDLADELGRSGRWVRQWVGDNLPETLYDRFPRPAGGAPELWAAPDAVAQLRDRFANGTNGGSPPAATEPTAEATAEPTEVREDGWRAAADAERRRADAAEARLDALRLELGTVREALVQAERRAEEADRGRHAAELRLEALRGDVWSWVALVRGLAWWRRLRHLPDPPPSLVAHERLLAKPEE